MISVEGSCFFRFYCFVFIGFLGFIMICLFIVNTSFTSAMTSGALYHAFWLRSLLPSEPQKSHVYRAPPSIMVFASWSRNLIIYDYTWANEYTFGWVMGDGSNVICDENSWERFQHVLCRGIFFGVRSWVHACLSPLSPWWEGRQDVPIEWALCLNRSSPTAFANGNSRGLEVVKRTLRAGWKRWVDISYEKDYQNA